MDAANEERVRERTARSVLRFSTQCPGHKQRFGAPRRIKKLSLLSGSWNMGAIMLDPIP
jgi:hypothetical protein